MGIANTESALRSKFFLARGVPDMECDVIGAQAEGMGDERLAHSDVALGIPRIPVESHEETRLADVVFAEEDNFERIGSPVIGHSSLGELTWFSGVYTEVERDAPSNFNPAGVAFKARLNGLFEKSGRDSFHRWKRAL
jgi:hypothetical protein